MTVPTSLDALNAAAEADFVAALDGVFEHAPWIAQRAAAARPFATVTALHEALLAALRAAAEPEQLAFLNGHPELAAEKLAGDLTAESRAEQEGLGMAAAGGAAELPTLNRAYRERFGLPFIICVARHTAPDVLRALQARLTRDPAAERAAALVEVGHITRLRLAQRVHGPGMPPIAGGLSCHALDVTAGRPAAELQFALLQEGRPVAAGNTNADGRSGAGLLPPGPVRQGRYELQFQVGAYFAARGVETFYEIVPIRFVIAAAEAHYHIPLLLAPYGYSTYRGS